MHRAGEGGLGAVPFTVADGSRLDITAGVSSHSGATLPGPVGIVKNGPGVLALTGANSYTGNTTVNAGLVEFNSASALGASNKVVLNGGGLRWASGSATDISARLDPLGTNGATFDTAGNSVAFASVLSGSGRLTKAGAGTLTLSAANTYSGGTVVDAGTLPAGHVNAFGSGSIRVNAGTLDFGGFAIANTLDVRGGTLSGLAAYADTHTVSGSASYSGTVGGSLTVAGGGSLNTTGAIFTGTTTVQSGGTLKGTGTVGPTTIQSGGTLSPGNSPGLLTFEGGLTLDVGSITVIEIAGLTRGASDGYDAINVNGPLSVGGALTVSFSGGYTPSGSGTTTFDLFKFTSFGGSFAQVHLPAVAGYIWNTSNLALDGTLSLVASAIPEPATFTVLASACALGFAFTRRRRRAV